MTIEHRPWPKIPRLFRECVITEKLDGTNSAVGIVKVEDIEELEGIYDDPNVLILSFDIPPYGDWAVYAQSRKRLITPFQDNFGFAKWVWDNGISLVQTLGEGLHFGEWWGSGIGRGYGLLNGEKRFSLFNVERYKDVDLSNVPGAGLVPVMYRGPFTTHAVEHQIAILAQSGSRAAPGFMRPEGVITFHTAANMVFKTTVEGDEKPKGSNELE